MKKQLSILLISSTLLAISCQKENEPEPVIPGMHLIGLFQVPDNKNITFDMQNTDGFASVDVNHEGRIFEFNGLKKGNEINHVIYSGEYFVRLKTYSKSNNTEVSYLLANKKGGEVIYSYVGQVKRIR